MTDRQMTHRVAPIRLEAKTLGDLTRQQVTSHVFSTRRYSDVACLKWCQPIGVDMGENTGSRTELQKRNVFALGNRAGELWLHFGNVGIGKPADQIDVVHREIDNDADIRHARRERSNARDSNRENIL